MISVLICSTSEFYLKQVRGNIEQTIGTEHEVLFFDNATEKKGICEVYNLLAAKAKFPYLCFIHEDIIFETPGWGDIISDIFLQNTQTGVIGVAGSKYKSKQFSGWFSGVPGFDCANITHQYPYGKELIYLNPGKQSSIEDVVCVDGVFICCRKSTWEKVKFNDNQLKGFHFYDIDFSINASLLCGVAVTYLIRIVHITKGGDFGNNWIESAIQYHSFSGNKLPVTKLVSCSAKDELKISNTWLDILKNYKISWKNKMRWITIQRLQYKPLLYYPIARFLFYEPFGLKRIHKLFRK